MSTKPISQKLLIKENYAVIIANEPAGYRLNLGNLPPKVTLSTASKEPVDLIRVFVTSKKELADCFDGLKKQLKPKGLLWVTYPKGTSKMKTDLNRDVIRELAQPFGLEAVAIVSIDDKWSALRLKKT